MLSRFSFKFARGLRGMCQNQFPVKSNIQINKIQFFMSEEQKQEQQPEQAPISKKQQKKLEKDSQKQARKQDSQQQQQQQQQGQEADPLADNYGDYALIQSQERTERRWTRVINIDESLVDQVVLVRARLHNSRVKGNLAFLVLRDQYSTIQAIAFKNDFVSKQMLKFISTIPSESVVDLYAKVTKPEQEILSCTQKVELQVQKLYIVSRSAPQLPFQIEDAQRRVTEEEELDVPKEQKDTTNIKVFMKTRLDHRVIDLRTPAKQAIFRVQSGVSQLFREFLLKHDFVEIRTPKLIGGASEGGTNVFKLQYFNKPACLAQSPQLYKQMVLMADMERVFEIAPVFRAENSNTHRHMCEFTSLDLEMTIKENYHELLDFLGELSAFIFHGIEERYGRELKAINEQFPFEPFKCKTPVVKLTFEEGVKLLQEAGVDQDPKDDLNTENEKKLGAIVKKIYDTDFYMLHRYPKNARPFYTMLAHDDPEYTNSYDFFMRGEEILSGAQRIHESTLLEKRATECNINVETIRDYINSFKYGAFPHGGAAFGLERIVFLYFGLGNIRNACLFPRDPQRIAP